MAELISFQRGRDQGGGWENGRLRDPPSAASPPPTLPHRPSPTPGDEIRSFYEGLLGEGEGGATSGSAPPPHFCPSCGTRYRDPPSQHRSSTAHLLALGGEGKAGPGPPPPPLHIPPSNVGFRLLLRGGWDPRGGLGPTGGGGRTPVPTLLKRDRGGLGLGGEGKPRVTHFGPGDEGAVAGPPRGGGRGKGDGGGGGGRKHRARRSEEAARAWERRLRWYMEH